MDESGVMVRLQILLRKRRVMAEAVTRERPKLSLFFVYGLMDGSSFGETCRLLKRLDF